MATAKSTESRDFYANMPDWQREQLMGDAAFESKYRDAMSNIANQAGKNPRTIAGISDAERAGLKAQQQASAALGKGLQGQIKGLNGIDVADGLGKIAGPKGMGDVMNVGNWNNVAGPSANFKSVAAPTFANIDNIRGGYENDYTDSVVDTTMAGMQRQAQRDQLARDARSSAIGGVTNSRSAVADAVAGQLTGMNMATTEAQLRSNAFDTAAKYGLQETDMRNQFGMDRADFMFGQNEAERQYGLDRAGFGLAQEQARTGFNLDRSAQSLNEQRARAENSLAMSGFNLERAMAEAAQGNKAAELALQQTGLTADMLQSIYGASSTSAQAQAGLGAEGRELRQKSIDSKYYSPMEAGSWLSEVYGASRTRDSAPYNYEGTAEADDGKKEPSKWQQFLGGAAAGLSSFL